MTPGKRSWPAPLRGDGPTQIYGLPGPTAREQGNACLPIVASVDFRESASSLLTFVFLMCVINKKLACSYMFWCGQQRQSLGCCIRRKGLMRVVCCQVSKVQGGGLLGLQDANLQVEFVCDLIELLQGRCWLIVENPILSRLWRYLRLQRLMMQPGAVWNMLTSSYVDSLSVTLCDTEPIWIGSVIRHVSPFS